MRIVILFVSFITLLTAQDTVVTKIDIKIGEITSVTKNVLRITDESGNKSALTIPGITSAKLEDGTVLIINGRLKAIYADGKVEIIEDFDFSKYNKIQIGGLFISTAGLINIINNNRELNDDASIKEAQDFIDTSKLYNNIANSFFIAGGIMIIFGIKDVQ